MFITTLFIIAKNWKQPRCLSTDEWIKKTWYIYTIDYYSDVKKQDLQVNGWNWGKIILSEVTQTQKNKYNMHSLIGRYYLLN